MDGETRGIALNIHKDMHEVMRIGAWRFVLFEVVASEHLVLRKIEKDMTATQSIHSLALMVASRRMLIVDDFAPKERYAQAALPSLLRVVVSFDTHFQQQTWLLLWLESVAC